MFHVSLISHLTDFNGRPSGEAYVQFTNVGDGKKALTKNKENMGHRWVGIGLLSTDQSLLFTSPGLGFSVLKGFRPVTEGAGESGRGGRELENILPIRDIGPGINSILDPSGTSRCSAPA